LVLHTLILKSLLKLEEEGEILSMYLFANYDLVINSYLVVARIQNIVGKNFGRKLSNRRS
jgi:hypothetical protein